MYTDLIHRIVIIFGFLAALICLAWNIFFQGNDLLWSAFVSLCVMFGVSTVLLMALHGVAQVLMRHLQERQQLQAPIEREAEEKRNS